MAQMLALSTYEKVHLHLNYNQSPVSTPYLSLAQSLFHSSQTNCTWLKRPNYLSMIASMDFAMQVTLSESFNYTAAEHMFFGVPVLLSKASPIGDGIPPEIKSLIVEKHDDVMEIKAKLNNLISSEAYRSDSGMACSEYIRNFNKKNLDILTESLTKVCPA
jgi:glycosyltransferase involved in cell wall biosynthesis